MKAMTNRPQSTPKFGSAEARQGEPDATATDPVCRLSTHVRDPAPNPDDIHWYRVVRPLEPARSLEHTCDRCRNVSYEYLTRGGRRLIRRRYRSPRGELVIHETPGLFVPAADELWRKILNGVAR